VRVAGDELVVPPPGNRGKIALASLLEQQRQEVGLEEEVAELVLELGGIAPDRGVCDFVGLLDRVRDDRASRLLPVPGTVAAEPLGQLLELEKRVGELLPVAQPVVESAGAVGL
jgi:hypothetical protein